MICDSGDRYADTYYDPAWLAAHDLAPDGYSEVLREFERRCAWPDHTGAPVAGNGR
jgi:cysteine synthase A